MACASHLTVAVQNILAAVELKERIGLAVPGLNDPAELAPPAPEVSEVGGRHRGSILFGVLLTPRVGRDQSTCFS